MPFQLHRLRAVGGKMIVGKINLGGSERKRSLLLEGNTTVLTSGTKETCGTHQIRESNPGPLEYEARILLHLDFL
jgi:hypothetical protein